MPVTFVAPTLHQDGQPDPVLIDGTPETMLFAADADEHLVQEPFVARLGPAPLEGIGELATEARSPSRIVS